MPQGSKVLLESLVQGRRSTHGNALGVAICAGADAYEQTFSGNAGTLGVTTAPSAGATTVGVDTGGGSAGAGGAAFNVDPLCSSKKQTDKSMKLLQFLQTT